MAEAMTTYDRQQIEARLGKDLPTWFFGDGAIQRRFETAGWKGALMVVGAVGHLAEAAWHHPDLEVSWGGVLVKLTTHSAGGVTELDFALAARIEQFVGWQPGLEPGPLPGTPDDPRYAYIKYAESG